MLFDFVTNAARRLNLFVKKDTPTDISFIESEIADWMVSRKRMDAVDGFLYYIGKHDILHKKRTAIGADGEPEEITNLPNRKDIDNQYAIAVDKKANYMLGKPIAVECENEEYAEILRGIFDKAMMKRLKRLSKMSMNGAVAWVMPYYDMTGKLKFHIFPAYEILPEWEDAEHTELRYVIRMYQAVKSDGKKRQTVDKVEIYRQDGVYR